MGWYLYYTTLVGKQITIPTLDIPAATDFEIEVEWFNEDTARGIVLANNQSATNQFFIEPSSTGNYVRFSSTLSGVNLNFGSMVRSDFNNIKVRRVGSTLSLLVNGIETDSATSSTILTSVYSFFRIFGRSGTVSSANSGLKFLKYTESGTLLRHYDASASGGTGTILPDIVNSANNGTQIGTWPANNDEWVFYDDGGATTSTIVAGIPVPAASVLTNAVAPAVSASISAGLPIPVASISALDFAPTFTATISGGLPVPSAAISGSVEAPIFSAVIAGGLPVPTASISALSIGLGNSAVINAGIPVPSASVSASVVAPIFSASISAGLPVPIAAITATNELTLSATISAGLPVPIASLDASVTLPDYIATITAGLPVPTAAIQINSGVRVIILPPEQLAALPSMSFTAALPPMSFIATLPELSRTVALH